MSNFSKVYDVAVILKNNLKTSKQELEILETEYSTLTKWTQQKKLTMPIARARNKVDRLQKVCDAMAHITIGDC